MTFGHGWRDTDFSPRAPPLETDDELRRILGHDRVAVVGASTSYEKAAHVVSAYLQRHGFERWPGNPNADEKSGRAASDSLTDVSGGVDTVELFRASEDVPGVVAAALERDDLAARDAEAAGLDVVQERCVKVEHGPPVRTP